MNTDRDKIKGEKGINKIKGEVRTKKLKWQRKDYDESKRGEEKKSVKKTGDGEQELHPGTRKIHFELE